MSFHKLSYLVPFAFGVLMAFPLAALRVPLWAIVTVGLLVVLPFGMWWQFIRGGVAER